MAADRDRRQRLRPRPVGRGPRRARSRWDARAGAAARRIGRDRGRRRARHHRDGALRPGKRPFFTLNPGLALKGDKPHLLYGTQGADGQPQTLTALLTRLIDYGLDPLEALARPRFLLGRTFSDGRDTLKLEASVPEDTVARLEALGHQVSQIPANSPLAGQAGAIVIGDNGRIAGAHDPRSDGCALGL